MSSATAAPKQNNTNRSTIRGNSANGTGEPNECLTNNQPLKLSLLEGILCFLLVLTVGYLYVEYTKLNEENKTLHARNSELMSNAQISSEKFKTEYEELKAQYLELKSAMEDVSSEKEIFEKHLTIMTNKAIALKSALQSEENKNKLLQDDINFHRILDSIIDQLTNSCSIVKETADSPERVIIPSEEEVSIPPPLTESNEGGILSEITSFLWSTVEKDVEILRAEFKKEIDKFQTASKKTVPRFKPHKHEYVSDDRIEGYSPSGPISLAPDKKNEFYTVITSSDSEN